MAVIKVLIVTLVTTLILIFTAVTMINLMYFLSAFPNESLEDVASVINATEFNAGNALAVLKFTRTNWKNTCGFKITICSASVGDIIETDPISIASWSAVIDILLLCGFIVQHSFIGSFLKNITSLLGIQYLERIFFNFLTSLILQILMYLWRPIPGYVLWSIDLDKSIVVVFFQMSQIVAWFIIYIISISFDVTEILGIKQVYYHITGRDISHVKSASLQHLQQSVQHPSFIGFLIILWVFPVMRLDRLFIAVIWTVYMALAWNPDENDLNYIIEQRARKFHSASS